MQMYKSSQWGIINGNMSSLLNELLLTQCQLVLHEVEHAASEEEKSECTNN